MPVEVCDSSEGRSFTAEPKTNEWQILISRDAKVNFSNTSSLQMEGKPAILEEWLVLRGTSIQTSSLAGHPDYS